jgi:hypothetical protein
MLPSNQGFKRKLLQLIILTFAIISILITALILLQKTIKNHYTTQNEISSESMNLYSSTDEEYKFIEKASSMSSVRITTIPNDLIQP